MDEYREIEGKEKQMEKDLRYLQGSDTSFISFKIF